MLSGIRQVASTADYKVMICQSNESYKTEVAHLQTLMANWIDGMLICHSLRTGSYEHLLPHLRKGMSIIPFYRVGPQVETPK